jgi:acyl carrier protein
MPERDTIAAIVRDVSPSIRIEAGRYGNSLFDLGLDSLDFATILLQVEEKFGVKIPDDIAATMLSISDIAAFVAAQRKT